MAVVTIEEALARSLEALERGTHSRQECLDRYPGMRADLEPLLDLVAEIRAIPYALPSIDFRSRMRLRLMARVRGRGLPTRRPAAGRHPGGFARRAGAWASIGATVLGLFATAGAAYASADALPGDFLYPAKLMVEAAEELLTFDPRAEAALHLRLAERRLGEMEALIEAGRLGEMDGLLLAFEYQCAEAGAAGSDGLPGQGLGIGQVPPGFVERIQVLEGLLVRVPDSARPALERVLTRAEAAISNGPGNSAEAPGHQDANPGQGGGGGQPPVDPGRPTDVPANPPESPPGQSGDQGNPPATPPGQSEEHGNPQGTPPGQSGK